MEDNPLNTKLISILFSQYGLTLQVAENGSIAIEKMKAFSFDLVLMDLEMPVLNGYQATTMIRHELKSNVPIIALTAHSMPGEREKCLQLGMNDILLKPVNADLLFTSVYNLTFNSDFHQEKTRVYDDSPSFVKPKKIYDLSYLNNATRGNKKIINSIIHTFLQQASEELSALNEAIKKTNYLIISHIAHKMRSSFLLMGITVLDPEFEEMEQLGFQSSGIEKIAQLNKGINAVFSLAKKEMEQKNYSELI